MSLFKKAIKSESRLRLALFAPSGGGKTYTALSIAKGLADAEGTKIAVIDTEWGSASKYADRFDFDVVNLPSQTIDEYVNMINAAATESYGVLIIDSLSHAWHELKELVAKIAKAKYKGNQWAAWSEGTPEQRKLVGAIIRYPGHLIATMRSNTEWSNENNRPTRVGLAPDQGKGIEYEFDMLMEMTTEHIAHVIKDRTGKFQGELIDRPNESFGRQLYEWLHEGAPLAEKVNDAQRKHLFALGKAAGMDLEAMKEFLASFQIHSSADIPLNLYPHLCEKIGTTRQEDANG